MDHGWLLPPSLHEFVPAGHPAHFIRDTVREGLDLAVITAFAACVHSQRPPRGSVRGQISAL